MGGPLVTAEVRPDGVGIVTLARPDRLNSISTTVADGIAEVAASFASDDAVRAIVVRGEGKAFCAGADIAEFAMLDSPAAFAGFLARLTDSLDALASCPKPSVAALHGVALGGGLELALACDLRVAEEGTRLGVPEIKLGLLPGAAGTVRLPRLVPAPVARRMLLTGEPLLADEALALGLVAEVAPVGGALSAAVSLASRLAALPPLALAAAKRLLAAGVGLPESAAVDLERQTVSMLFGTADRAEGVAAFLDKRPPTFRGS
jgi:enoyl-CoA hydratase/carnithine racemase